MAKALEHLNRIKRYPTSREARLTHPQGTVKLKILIQRDGSVTSVELVNSSGSNLLDNEALRTVKNTQFPPIPEDAFPGESNHFVIAALLYEVPGQ